MKHSLKQHACRYCKKSDLYWSYHFGGKKSILVDTRGVAHWCKEGMQARIDREAEHLSPTTCKYCGSTDVLWSRVERDCIRYEMIESYGLPHVCEQWTAITRAHREAKREDYALEKQWVNSFADGTECKKCGGHGTRERRGRKLKYPLRGPTHVRCKKCRGIGKFTPESKRGYLEKLRKKHWPYQQWMTRKKNVFC